MVQTFLAPKQGEDRESCEDSIRPEPGKSADGAFAVSDGTTTSFFSGLWARILTRRFAENPSAAFDSAWHDWLGAAQKDWQAEVRQRAEATDASFYTRNDVLGRKPAAATFVGLVLDPPKPGGGIPWRALVLGDSCLFLLGKDGPRSMELTKAEEFSYIVKAAESYAVENPHLPKRRGSSPEGTEPDLIDGDSILLATDALSKWLLLRAEHDRPVWGSVLSLATEGDFETFVHDARRESDDALENDDVALAVLKIGDPHESYRQCRFEPKPRVEKPCPPPPSPSPIASSKGDVPPAKGVRPREMPLRRLPNLQNQIGWVGAALALVGMLSLGLGLVIRREVGRARSAESAVADLRRAVASKDQEAARLSENISRMETEEGMLHQQIAAKTGEAARLTAKINEIEELRKVAHQGIEAKRTEVESLKARLDDLEAQNKKLAAKSAEIERQKTALDDQLKRAAESARERADETGKAKIQIDQLKADNESMRKEIADKEKQIKALKDAPVVAPSPPPGKAQDAGSAHGQGTPVKNCDAGLPETQIRDPGRA